MHVYTTALSRLVPILLFASFCLILGRWLHDLIRPRSRAAARVLFSAVLVLGGFFVTPYCRRLVLLVWCAKAFDESQWAAVDASMSQFRSLGGTESIEMNCSWAVALINAGKPQKAEAVLLSRLKVHNGQVEAVPQQILLLGTARYYERNFRSAVRTLGAVGEQRGLRLFLRDYLIGRSHEALKEPELAMSFYGRATAREPRFYPAVYHLARLQVEAGHRDDGLRTLTLFSEQDRNDATLAAPALASMKRGQPLPNVEFQIVQN
jgi:tetratricopeptide (TPR) repeat protein